MGVFFDVREEMSVLSARVWLVSATTPQQHQHPDNRAKRFVSGSSCLGCLVLFQLFRLLQHCLKFIICCFGLFQAVVCSKTKYRSLEVGLRGFNLFVICATLFYDASGRFSGLKCLVVFGCSRIFKLFMMYKSCWMCLRRFCCCRLFFQFVFILSYVVESETVDPDRSLCFNCCKVGFKMF